MRENDLSGITQDAIIMARIAVKAQEDANSLRWDADAAMREVPASEFAEYVRITDKIYGITEERENLDD